MWEASKCPWWVKCCNPCYVFLIITSAHTMLENLTIITWQSCNTNAKSSAVRYLTTMGWKILLFKFNFPEVTLSWNHFWWINTTLEIVSALCFARWRLIWLTIPEWRPGRTYGDNGNLSPLTFVRVYIRGFTKSGIKVLGKLRFLEYLRTLCLKFQTARTKIEVVLSLPCWLSQLNWDSQLGRL